MAHVFLRLPILVILNNLFHCETVRPKFAQKTIIRARFPLKGYENTGMRVATLISNAEATYSPPLSYSHVAVSSFPLLLVKTLAPLPTSGVFLCLLIDPELRRSIVLPNKEKILRC